MQINEKEVIREDYLSFAINGVTKSIDSAFNIEHVETNHRWVKFYERLSLEYVMNRDVEKVEREVYNFAMLLGDIGGLYGFLVPLVGTILGFLNFQKVENKLVQQLYPRETTLEAAKLPVVKECLLSICCVSRCKQRTPRDKLFDKARSRLNDDLDVVTLLKKLRLFGLAIRKTVPADDLADYEMSLDKVEIPQEQAPNLDDSVSNYPHDNSASTFTQSNPESFVNERVVVSRYVDQSSSSLTDPH